MYENKEDMLKGALQTAKKIAENSQIVVHGTKVALNYADDHSTKDGSAFRVGLTN